MASTVISKIDSLGSIPSRGAIHSEVLNMVIMTKEEVKSAAHTWPANIKQPIDRDTQIHLMKTAAWRHKVLMNKYKEMFAKKGKDHDPIG